VHIKEVAVIALVAVVTETIIISSASETQKMEPRVLDLLVQADMPFVAAEILAQAKVRARQVAGKSLQTIHLTR
jgi:hypothetical protein